PSAGTVPRLSAFMMLRLSCRCRFVWSGSAVFIDFPLCTHSFFLQEHNSLCFCLPDQDIYDPGDPAGTQQPAQVRFARPPVGDKKCEDFLLWNGERHDFRQGVHRLPCSSRFLRSRRLYDRTVREHLLLCSVYQDEKIVCSAFTWICRERIDTAEAVLHACRKVFV